MMMEGTEALDKTITSQTTVEQAAMPELPPLDSDAESNPARGIKAPEELAAPEPLGTPMEHLQQSDAPLGAWEERVPELK